MMRIPGSWPALLASLLALAGCDEAPPLAVGQLESDRVEVVVEFNEPITAIEVREGDSVSVDDLLVQQDTRRIELRLQEAEANITRLQAVLSEQENGPRPETITAMRASLSEAVIERDFRERELARLTGLRERNLTSVESVDTASKLLDAAAARVDRVSAQLAELEAGTRVEQLAQTHAALAQARAGLAGLELDRRRHALRAPVAGTVDSLPFEPGERPRPGEAVAILLTGSQPYARIYVPEPQRLSVRVGSELPVHIDGLDQPLTGTIRRIAAEATFTPYFALTERDRSRLSYVAELALPNLPERLPEGLPVQVFLE